MSIFPAVVFDQWEKDKMLSIFPFRVFGPCVGLGIEVAPERQPGMAPLLQSLKLFSTPAMVAQDPTARVRTVNCLAPLASVPSASA